MADYRPPVFTMFDNGVELVSMRNELLSASQIGFIRGARHDPYDAVGMAHFAEHLGCHGASERVAAAIAKRCPRRPSPVTEGRANLTYRKFFGGSNGPGINVYTLTGQVGFGHQDLFRPRYLPEVFGVVGGMVRDMLHDVRDTRVRDEAIVSPALFAVEKSAVLHETAENDEWPAMAGYRVALKGLYTKNPARNFGDSEPSQLERLEIGRVKFWTQQNFVPRTMKVIVLGPSRDAAVKLVRETGLNRIRDVKPSQWRYDRSDDLPVLSEVRHLETRGRGRMSHVCMLWPTGPYGGPDMYALEVLAGLMKDRIEEELREKQRAVYHPAVNWDATSSHGFLSVEFSTLMLGADCDRVIRCVLDVLGELPRDRSETFAREVEAGRFNLANTYLEQYRYMPGAFADRMLTALANGDAKLKRFNTYYADMLRVSPTQVRNAAARYLHRDKFVLSVVRPALEF